MAVTAVGTGKSRIKPVFKVQGGTKNPITLAALKNRIKLSLKDHDCIVIVGFRTPYAPMVHENLEMKLQGVPRPPPKKGFYWGPIGRSKFLEVVIRTMTDQMCAVLNEALAKGDRVKKAMWRLGKFIQFQSQARVPVDTKDLRDSAFTRYD